ncbi:MAG: TatD family hydrolase [Actinomycetota bacterium]|nr:TatD family hydrolase [Actinomycetota bacterium]
MNPSVCGLIDTHCHLQDLDEPEEAYASARAAGVVGLICVGADVDRSVAAVEMAGRFEGVWATAGLHPHDAGTEGGIEALGELVSRYAHDEKLVAVGECGLDYHYDNSPRDVQREVFGAQIAMAAEHDLTLVIHTREAWEDTFSLLRQQRLPERIVFHCFTGGPDEARRCLDLGAWLSFSGIVTFRSAGYVRDAAAICPAERLLVETDSPFLAPVPHRGRPNEPALVVAVADMLCEVRSVPADELRPVLLANAQDAFCLESLGG